MEPKTEPRDEEVKWPSLLKLIKQVLPLPGEEHYDPELPEDEDDNTAVPSQPKEHEESQELRRDHVPSQEDDEPIVVSTKSLPALSGFAQHDVDTFSHLGWEHPDNMLKDRSRSPYHD